MTEQELFKQVHDQVLGYIDTGWASRCADWGYKTYQMISEQDGYQHDLYLFVGREQWLPFICAVSTAVIIGEFAKYEYDDPFDNEAEIDLDLLDMSFEQIKNFLNENTTRERFELLEEANCVGLQDIWTEMCEWKQYIFHSLDDIYRQRKRFGEEEPVFKIFNSLLMIFAEVKEFESGGKIISKRGISREGSAFSYVSDSLRQSV